MNMIRFFMLIVFLCSVMCMAQQTFCEHCKGTGIIKTYEKCSNEKCRHGNVIQYFKNSSNKTECVVMKCNVCSAWNTDKKGYRLVSEKKCVYCSTAWLRQIDNKKLNDDIDFFTDKSRSSSCLTSTVTILDVEDSKPVRNYSRLPPLCKRCKGNKQIYEKCANEFHTHIQKKLGTVCPECGTTRGKLKRKCDTCQGTGYSK